MASEGLISPCCWAPVAIGGEGLTHWYYCTGCEAPCDPIPGSAESQAEGGEGT